MKPKKSFFSDRSRINITIDIILFILLALMTGIGLLIKYILISGEERNLRYGGGFDLTFWGLDRHQWGTIHLIVSLTFILLIVLHIIFHWKMIVNMLKRLMPNKAVRVLVSFFLTTVALFLFTFWIMILPELIPRERGYIHRHSTSFEAEFVELDAYDVDSLLETSESHKEQTMPKKQEEERDNKPQRKHQINFDKYEVNGSQTLYEVAQKYNVSTSSLCDRLGIPLKYSDERLGQLRKEYNFSMRDVSVAISEIKEHQLQ